MATFPLFAPEHFELIAQGLADVVTGKQLDNFFSLQGITDTSGHSTKWRRIYDSLMARQKEDRCGNNVAAFIMSLMSPARHVNNQIQYEEVRDTLNKVLIFNGLELTENGQFRKVSPASNISEAKRRADGIALRLRGRDIHPEILRYCKEELMQENYFHAVFEAAKSLAARLREMTGLSLDGAALIDKCFAENDPLIWINSFVSETDKSEHKGFSLLLKGAFVAIRNPTAHQPKIFWKGEDDAADYFTLLSMLHRKLDSAKAIKKN